MKTTNITIKIQCNLEDIKEISSVTKDNIKTYIIKFNSIYKALQFEIILDYYHIPYVKIKDTIFIDNKLNDIRIRYDKISHEDKYDIYIYQDF